MNKFLKQILLLFLPFYPFLARAAYFISDKGIVLFVSVITIPLALYFLASSTKKLPKYLLFFIAFTIYHVVSAILNKAIPPETNLVYFALSDYNIFACSLFIIVEHVDFDEEFISKMNTNILLVVIASLVVSIIQINDPLFYFNKAFFDEDLFYYGESRNYSIFSWVDLSSVGVTFPLMIAILLNMYEGKNFYFFFIIFCGIIVSFLTKSRYIMISVILVFSQFFFGGSKTFAKKITFLLLFAGSVLFIGFVAKTVGFDVDKVISNRVLEKEDDMGSAKARITSYEVFLQVFPQNPVLGVGPKTKDDVLDMLSGKTVIIHVGYLSYLYFYGIIGFLIFMLALFYLLKDAWAVGKSHGFWAAFYGILAFCLANLTLVYFNLSESGIILAVVYMRYFKYSLYENTLEDGITVST